MTTIPKQQTNSNLYPNPGLADDDTLAAALYGTSCSQITIALRNISRLEGILSQRCDDELANIDVGLADALLQDHPELVGSEEKVFDDTGAPMYGLASDEAVCILRLRHIEKTALACDMLVDWDESIRRRGRDIGAAEHAVRIHLTGRIDRHFKDAKNLDAARGGL